jgi:signal transduction histidine kinase
MDPGNGGRAGMVSRLKRLWMGNKKIRLLLTLELAVMLPAAALIFLNYYQLQSIERDKALEAAIHRDFQQLLAISEKQINHKAYTIVEGVRERFPSPDAAKDEKIRQLDLILAQHAPLAHVFLFDTDGGLMIFRSNAERMSDLYFVKEHERLKASYGGWLAMDSKAMLEALRHLAKPISWYPDRGKRASGVAYTATAFFTLPGTSPKRVVLGGATLEPDYLKRTLFPEMLDGIIAYKSGEEGGNPLAMAIYPGAPPGESEGWSPIGLAPGPLAASAGWTHGAPEVTRNMDGVFRGLMLGIKFQGTSVAEIGRGWVRNSFLALGIVSLLLVGGLALTYRSVSKEVALARLKSDFVSNVSHELRTPLALIRLYAETLELGRVKARDKVEEYYRIIRTESERLTALINNILDFSRIEAGRKEYEFRQTDVGELVTNTLEAYRDQIDQQGFTFEQSIAPDIPAVRVDREAIARSLVNLLNNALKYSDREKFVGVKLYRTDGVLKLEVADRGIGIARNEQSKIFEKFYRASDPLVHNTKGSGLGLSLVRHIAHAHGGDVEVQSLPGKGSTFTLTLPLDREAPHAAGEDVRMAG